MSDLKDNRRAIKNITVLSLSLNIALVFIKFTFGILGGSQAVVADAWHALSDTSTDLLILIGVRFWSAPPDKNHPYGYLRIEAIVTAIIGLVVTYVAIDIGWEALSSIGDVHSRPPTWIASIGPIITIISKEWLHRLGLSVGKRVQSSAVIANANKARTDVFSSIPALIGSLVPALFPALVIVDHLGAFVISLLLLDLGWKVIKPALWELTEFGATEEIRREILRIVKSVEGVKAVRNLRSRRMGSKYFVDLTVAAAADLSVAEGHVITEEIRSLLIKKGPNVVDVVVQLAPFSRDAHFEDLDQQMSLSMLTYVEGGPPVRKSTS